MGMASPDGVVGVVAGAGNFTALPADAVVSLTDVVPLDSVPDSGSTDRNSVAASDVVSIYVPSKAIPMTTASITSGDFGEVLVVVISF
jgi:hypothetical protein